MHRTSFRFSLAVLGVVALLCEFAIAVEATYQPLATAQLRMPKPLDLIVKDDKRSREIPLRVYLPRADLPAPVIVFSHGLGGSREGNAYMGEHWAARGLVTIIMQHPGSDDSVWRNKPLAERLPAMQRAAGLENFLLRVKDVPVVLDQLDRWNKTEGHPLANQMDLDHVGMSGHSFGAVTTQAVSGQSFARGGIAFTDKRIKAAIAFSPSGTRTGADPVQTFGQVKIPWMLMTGTKDVAPIGTTGVKSRLSVYPALPPDDKYELVLNNAEHSAFTERCLPGDKEERNPNHHRVILALSTAFWDAYLRNDAQAKAWLNGDGPQTLLEPGDKWQTK
jgi:predicted dienelactone hydrolase